MRGLEMLHTVESILPEKCKRQAGQTEAGQRMQQLPVTLNAGMWCRLLCLTFSRLSGIMVNILHPTPSQRSHISLKGHSGSRGLLGRGALGSGEFDNEFHLRTERR